jgi:tetratricopeptide (TPR) repeat protein
VKPSNLLLDNEGQLFVTDFGLAMTQADSNLTMTGDLLGTLRYMSPEQASGRRALVDRRTDIYSLGASLYELATLQPAFPEEDRTKLLQQIVIDLPRLPSQINRHVPKDLETIIFKAITKEPAERYATAQELADDLTRHLNDEPIRARRPGPAERVAKWSRRHRNLVSSIFVVLILSVVGLSVSALLISQQRNSAQAAAIDAKTQRSRAEGNLLQARAAVDKMFTKVAEELADRPHTEKLRRELLEEMLQIYRGFLIASEDDPDVRYETALVHGRIAEIYGALGDFDNCLKQYEWQHRIILALQQQFPKNARYSELLAQSFASVGEVLLRLNRLDSGAVQLDAALRTWKRLAADHPTNPRYRREIAAWYLSTSRLYHPSKMSDPAKSVKQVRQGLQMLDDLERGFPAYPIDDALRAKGHQGLGFYLSRLCRYDEAEFHLRKSMALKDIGKQTRLLAALLLMRGELDEAEDLARKSIDNYQRIIDDHPDSMTPDTELRKGFNLLADILTAAERWNEAEDAATRRLQIDAKWYDRFPDDANYRHGVAWSRYELGHVRFGAGKMREAANDYRQAIAHFEALAEQFPNLPRHHNALAYVLSTSPAKELRNPDRAVSHAHRALQLSPDNPDYWVVLATAQFVVGDYKAARASTDQAQKYLGDRLPSDAKLVLAMALYQSGARDEGREMYGQTVAEIESKQTYSEWYKMEFRVLRADADRMFSDSPEQN